MKPPPLVRFVEATLVTSVLMGCSEHQVIGEGQIGRPIPIMTGDGIPLVRLGFLEPGCPGPAGGCADGTECRPILLDSLVPLTAVADDVERSRLAMGCLEVRSASGLAADDPSPQDLGRAVTRFRFHEVPIVHAPASGTPSWTWTAGLGEQLTEPAAVLGGNVLRDFAVQIRVEAQVPMVAFYGTFPGTNKDLARQGRAFLPLQFPGGLLGRAPSDACDIDGSDCGLGTFNFEVSREDIALFASRMVMDACLAPPPCTLTYEPSGSPQAAGICRSKPGPDSTRTCSPAAGDLGGRPASLVIATGIPGLVLFADSAQRLFGPLDEVPDCMAIPPTAAICLEGTQGRLHAAGWPSAGEQEPLPQLRVRSVALVPGATQTQTVDPCVRVQTRQDALLQQCFNYTAAVNEAGNLVETTPPYAPNELDDDASDLAVLGEAYWPPGALESDPDRWISAVIVPPTHELAVSVRHDVTPEAIQPDGLLGTALFEATEVVLDYTDPSPGIRVSCVDPGTGRCQVAPHCAKTGDPSCCFGLPIPLLEEFITQVGDEACCRALPPAALADIQDRGEFCLGVDPL